MFAHVVTARAEAEGLGSLIRFSREQLPAIRQQPGFRGYYLLNDPRSGKLMTISLWETQEHSKPARLSQEESRGSLPSQVK
jgi:heme-degrading monooxygenase HmoA